MPTIEVHDQAVRQALGALAARLANPRRVLVDIGEGIVQRAKARFGAQAGPDGAAWKPKQKADGRQAPLIAGQRVTAELRTPVRQPRAPR
jgi:hypothetical protein